MTWNYRLVNMPSKNGGEKWLELCEVYYDRKGRPVAYASPCLGSETRKGAAWVGRKIAKGMSQPPLHEKMFGNVVEVK